MGFLLSKIIPLYALIAAGFVLKRTLKLEVHTIAALLVYFLAPMTFFAAVIGPDFEGRLLILVGLMLATTSFIGGLTYCLSRSWGSLAGVVAFASAIGNTGYFGLPLVLALWGPAALPMVVAIVMGSVLFEVSLGFYLMARGHYSPRESWRKMLHLPSIYAFGLGLIIHYAQMKISPAIFNFLDLFKSAYSVLGMLLIGVALGEMAGKIRQMAFWLKGMLLALGMRFLLWPILAAGTIVIARHLGIVWPLAEKVWFTLSAVPIGANTVAYATELKQPAKYAAILVAISTLLGLILLPFWLIMGKAGGIIS